MSKLNYENNIYYKNRLSKKDFYWSEPQIVHTNKKDL